MDSKLATNFAAEWIGAWNEHDLPCVLSHYTEDFEMSSPKIVEIAGEPSGRLVGKDAVGAYWATALARIPDLRFELLAVMHGNIRSSCIIAAQGDGLPPRCSI